MGGARVKYLLLIYETNEAFADRDSEPTGEFWGAWHAYTRALVASGVYLGGRPLEPPESAATVRVEGGRRRVHDGPFAETKEQLGGYILLDVPSPEVALDWAARCPAASYGAVEVRALSPTTEDRVFEGNPAGVDGD